MLGLAFAEPDEGRIDVRQRRTSAFQPPIAPFLIERVDVVAWRHQLRVMPAFVVDKRYLRRGDHRRRRVVAAREYDRIVGQFNEIVRKVIIRLKLS